MNKKQKIYHAYITRDDKTTAQDIADQFKVTRRYVYQAVEEVTKGAKSKKELKEKVALCVQRHQLHCLWECRFQDWYQAIGDNIKTNVHLADQFALLVQTMKQEGFNTSDIARLTKKDHATIRYHLSKK